MSQATIDLDNSNVVRALEQMIKAAQEDRRSFHEEARKGENKNYALTVDAAACAIREKALRDALAVVKRG